ncbi:MAG: TonB C-terminal domain-containing protein [Acidobacteriota bacterium]|nr:TonB C-terminal domain-containing protein [Acidobacteriota bacterium]
MSYFDFDGRYDDEGRVGSALSWRESVLVSLLVHALLVIAMLVLPDVPWFAEMMAPDVVAAPASQEERPLPFMMVEASRPAPADRPRVASDMDRRAASPEKAVRPTNDEPVSRGNTADMMDGTPAPPVRGPETSAPPSAAAAAPPSPSVAGTGSTVPRPAESHNAPSGLGAALRNMDQLIRRERFDNPQGGQADSDAAISFDSKGVDFGPWLSRFVAQVKRNWMIPIAAQTMSGRVVITFNVHRNGRITDLQVVKPSGIGAFNSAAFQALVQSNPTLQLPAEYPDDKVLFTVTFFYNERPR